MEENKVEKAVNEASENTAALGYFARQREKKRIEKEKWAAMTTKQKVLKEIKEWGVSLLVAIAAVLVLKYFLVYPITVSGDSMNATLIDRERLFVTAYDVNIYNGLERGDVVICHYPGRTNKHPVLFFLTVKTHLVKRIVGLPGDTVKRVNGVTYVNDVALDPLRKSSTSYTYEKAEDGTITYYCNGVQKDYTDAQTYNKHFDYEYVLGEDEYFVVGDNRYNSHDCREWNGPDLPYHSVNNNTGHVGPITKKMIIGHVRSVFWPLSKIRSVPNNVSYVDPRDSMFAIYN